MGGREGGREGEREGGREGREGRREGRADRGREGGRERLTHLGQKKVSLLVRCPDFAMYTNREFGKPMCPVY